LGQGGPISKIMAPKPEISEEERYQRLSDLYLTLWKQLDSLSGNTKWLEIRPASQVDLQREAEVVLAELKPCFRESDVLADVIDKDFRKTHRFLEGAGEIDGMNLEVFKDYLRDHALRYAQAADEPRITRQ
jgi:hypothetical protein